MRGEKIRKVRGETRVKDNGEEKRDRRRECRRERRMGEITCIWEEDLKEEKGKRLE